MKKVNFLYLMLLVVVFSACNSDDDDPWGDWAKSNTFPGEYRTLAVSFQSEDGENVYVGMGRNQEKEGRDKYLKSFYRFNEGKWSEELEDFPGEGREGCVAFVIEDTAYVGAGFREKQDNISLDTYYSDFYKFVISKEEWAKEGQKYLTTDIADYFKDTAPCKFWCGIGFELGGKGYVGTGHLNGRTSKNMYSYDPATGKWSPESMPGDPRAGAVVFKIGETAVICLGAYGSTPNVGVVTFDGKWGEKEPLVSNRDGEWNDDYDEIPRQYAVAFTSNKDYGNCGYIAGGTSNTVWRYSLEKDRWHEVEHFSNAMHLRSAAVGFSINQIGYITTGGSSYKYANNNTTWMFNPGVLEDDHNDYSIIDNN